MARGKQMPLSQMYVFDLESCDHVDYLDMDVPIQRAWLSGFMNIQSEEIKTFTVLNDCLNSLLAQGGNQNVDVAVHNLSFDGSFIIPELVKMGYDPAEGKPGVGEFSVLISDRNQWYSIQVRVTKKRRITFWDTAKLFPMPLAFLHTVYNTPTKKLDEDEEFYNAIRELDHEVTTTEYKYFYNDLKVLQEVLKAHINFEGLTFKKTQASQAFYNFTESFKAWKLRFPSISEEIDQAIRPAYVGGISYVNPLYQEEEVYDIASMDINSSYPFELSDKPLPYGHMNRVTTNEHPRMGQFWVARAVVKFDLKRDKLPCIATRQILLKPIELLESDLKWADNSYGYVEMVFSSIDYLTYTESYNFEVIEWVRTYHWAQKKHKEVAEFVMQNNDNKIKYRSLADQTPPGILKDEYLAKAQRAKINNNAFYGKFGEEIVKIGKNVVVDDDLVSYVESREEVLTPFKRKFLPVAIATTAYARAHLVKTVNILGKSFIYCDTDSVYYLDLVGNLSIQRAIQEGLLELDDLKLGAWSFEGYYTRGLFLRPKTYILEGVDKKGSVKNYVTCAGLPADKGEPPGSKKRSCLNFDNFKIGTVVNGGNGKLRPILTATGKKLVPVDFEIGANKLFMF